MSYDKAMVKIKAIESFIKTYFDVIPQGRSLDVGCGPYGSMTKALKDIGFESHGFDYIDFVTDQAKKNHPDCSFFIADGTKPEEIGKGKFDFIIANVFYPIDNAKNLLEVKTLVENYFDILNPKGFFIIVTNRWKSKFEWHLPKLFKNCDILGPIYITPFLRMKQLIITKKIISLINLLCYIFFVRLLTKKMEALFIIRRY